MPSYLFSCEACGEFEQRRPMSEVSLPASCPHCAGAGRRVFSAPSVRRSTSARRAAHEREERSRHEPKRASRPTGKPIPHVHGASGQPWAVSH